MTEPTLDALTTRLERLERESRRSKRAMLVVLVGTLALALMGQAPPHRMPKSLEAEEFVLRDSRGQVRAVLGTAQNGSATMLQIFGENGKPRTSPWPATGPRASRSSTQGSACAFSWA